MNECMPRSPALYLSEADEVATFEVASAVLELPKRRLGRASVKDIAYYAGHQPSSIWRDGKHTFMKAIHIELAYE